MSYNSSKKAEPQKAKYLRITMAVLYFIEVVLTTFPFMRGVSEDGTIEQLTAFEIVIQPGGYDGAAGVKLALIFAVLLLFPIVSFFFCVLDKSIVKNIVSVACCFVCACIITFGIGMMIDIGALVSLLLYILILFVTTANMNITLKS